MNADELFPYVVPKGYLQVPGLRPRPSLDQYGVVEPLGPDLFRMLIHVSEGSSPDAQIIRNVHEDDLRELGLTVEEAKAKSLENLEAKVRGGEDFQIQATMSEGGLGHILWMGHWLAASCIVLPGLHKFASGILKTDEMLVSVPQQRCMFLFSAGDADYRREMRKYIRKVVEGMDKLVTFDLFLLSERGLEPCSEPRKGMRRFFR